jgi:phosphoribosylformimino-5-aminoimidazole carboxamide ribotide isomerase
MLILPSIDLLDGKVVRLVHGDRARATIYPRAPIDCAQSFRAAGAARLHVVDLDAAFGSGDNAAAIDAIAKTGSKVQIGGGIRDLASCRRWLDRGCERVVLGTSAVKDPDFVQRACREFAGRVVVAVDARGGKVAVEGWTQATDADAAELAARAADWGAAAILYTDIARDGTGDGPDVARTAALTRALPIAVIASGGIGSLDHLRALAAAGVAECVVGRALHDETFTLAEAIAAATSSGAGA